MFTNMGLWFRNRRNYVVYVLEDNCKKLKFNDFIVDVFTCIKVRLLEFLSTLLHLRLPPFV